MKVLTVIVESFHNKPVAQSHSRTLQDHTLSIGRGKDNQLRLDDKRRSISRVHCRIERQDQQFFIIDESSNGLYVNSARDPLGKGNRQRLHHDDILRLGPFQLRVRITDSQPAPAAGENLDETRFMAVRPEELPRVDVEHGSFGTLDEALPDESGPASIDDTGLTSTPPPPAPTAEEPPDLAMLLAGLEEADSPTTPTPGLGNDELAALDELLGAGSKAVSTDIPPPPPPFPPEAATDAAPPPDTPPSPDTTPPAPALPESVTTPTGADAEALLRAFLQGAGLPPLSLPPERQQALFRDLGKALRMTTENLILMLEARGLNKQEMDMEVTTIQAVGNNPLKFPQGGVDGALGHLLFPKGEGYMPLVQAFAEAFDDLGTHYTGSLRGFTAALRGLLARFEPEVLEEEINEHSRITDMLPGARASRYWEAYRELYRDIAEQAGENFLELIQPYYSPAYDLRKPPPQE